jgi:uncharacterized protein YecE (DUF72 family)
VLGNFLNEITPLSPGARFAVEFRHRSWHTSSTQELLASAGVCWATTEYPKLPRQIHRTANYLYIRWIGQHGSYRHHDHERVDKTPDLQEWLKIIKDQSGDVQEIYGFFNNDYAGFAAGTCNKFKAVAGLPVRPLLPPQQGRLF